MHLYRKMKNAIIFEGNGIVYIKFYAFASKNEFVNVSERFSLLSAEKKVHY